MSREFNPIGRYSWDRNPYSSPEPCGLELFASLDSEYAGSYEFDILAVWIDLPTSTLLAARDSGCSCPTPFEDYTHTGQMVEVRSWDDIQGLIGDDGGGFDSADRFKLRRRVESYLDGMSLANQAVDEFRSREEEESVGTSREEELLTEIQDLKEHVEALNKWNTSYVDVIRAQGGFIESIKRSIAEFRASEARR